MEKRQKIQTFLYSLTPTYLEIYDALPKGDLEYFQNLIKLMSSRTTLIIHLSDEFFKVQELFLLNNILF